MTGVIATLQAAAADAAVEDTPVVRALRAGAVSRIGYVGYLRVLAVVHACLESTLRRVTPTVEAIDAVWPQHARPYELLLEDLDHFRPEIVPDVMPAMNRAAQVTQSLIIHGAASRDSLLGFVFALETLRYRQTELSAIRDALGVDAGRGASYLTDASREVEQRWSDLAAKLEAQLDDAAEASEAAAGLAHSLASTFARLEPFEPEQLGIHVLSLNPEGGAHPVTQDRDALRAALAATDRCFATHGYFTSRYGTRGRFFTDSDGAWLAYLAGCDEETRTERVEWLRRLLSARGMPTRVLQLHLELLADELMRALPDSGEQYRVLYGEADRLGAELRAALAPEAATALVDAFAERAVGDLRDAQARELGRLVVDAVIDESTGLDRAVPSVRAWVADERRFSARWLEAVDELLSGARSAVSRG